jgi:uncharacterized protein YerC
MLSKDIWKKEMPMQLATVLVSIDSAFDMQNLLRDLMTEKEIIEISARLEAARMLKIGKKYTEVIQRTNLSSRTVARISDWLKNGSGGYETAINNIEAHYSHISPGRD